MFKLFTGILDYDSHSPAHLEFFLSSDPIMSSTVAFPALGNSNHVAISTPLTFLQIQRGIILFIAQL